VKTNRKWVDDLIGPPHIQELAIEDLRHILRRGIFHYLYYDRSDLQHYTLRDLELMADDMVQEAVLRVLDKMDTFRGESRFTTWAMRVAINIAIGELRRARYQDCSLDALSADDELLPLPQYNAKREQHANPERSVECSDTLLWLTDAMKTTLTARQYQALTSVMIHNVPTDIAALQMNTTRNAVHKLIYDARLKLRRYVELHGLSPDYLCD